MAIAGVLAGSVTASAGAHPRVAHEHSTAGVHSRVAHAHSTAHHHAAVNLVFGHKVG
jgi:hypothetical protein